MDRENARRSRTTGFEGEESQLPAPKNAAATAARFAQESLRFTVLAVALIPPLLLGGATGLGSAAIAMLCVLAASVSLGSHRNLTFGYKPLDLAIVCLLFFTGFQLLPLPIALGLSAQTETARTLDLIGITPRFLPITYDVAATREALVVGSGAVAAYFLGRHAAQERKRSLVILAVFGSTVLVAMIGLAHELFSATKVFGLHQPVHTAPALLAPLLNNNHLGGFLAFGATLGLALTLHSPHRSEKKPTLEFRFLTGAGTVITLACSLLAVSRGAVLSLLFGIPLVILVRTFADRRKTNLARTRTLTTLAVVGVTAIALLSYLGLDALRGDFERSDYSKLSLASDSLALFREHWLVGVGRGAFPYAFLSRGSAEIWSMNPENIVAQWLSEWGIVFPLLFALAAAPVFWRSVFSRRLGLAGAALALLGFVVHDLVDYALEMPGILAPLALLLGALATSERDRKPIVSAAPDRFQTKHPAPVYVALSVAALSVLFFAPQVPLARTEAMIEAMTAGDHDREKLALDVATHHSSDAALLMHVAEEKLRARDSDALRWLNRAMEVAPSWPGPHLLAAAFFLERSALDQAQLELVEAERHAPGRGVGLACEHGNRNADFARILARRVPDEEFLDRISPCLSDPAHRALEESALEYHRMSEALYVRRARRLVRNAQSETDAERRADMLADAENALGRARGQSTLPIARAEWLVAMQRNAEALSVLGSARASSDEYARIRASVANQLSPELRETDLQFLRSQAAGHPSQLAAEWMFAGHLARTRNELNNALQHYQTAHRLQPSNVAILASVEQTARELGQTLVATQARTERCDLGDAAACAAAPRPAP